MDAIVQFETKTKTTDSASHKLAYSHLWCEKKGIKFANEIDTSRRHLQKISTTVTNKTTNVCFISCLKLMTSGLNFPLECNPVTHLISFTTGNQHNEYIYIIITQFSKSQDIHEDNRMNTLLRRCQMYQLRNRTLNIMLIKPK